MSNVLKRRPAVAVVLALAIGLIIGTAGGGVAGGSGIPANKVTAAGAVLAEISEGENVQLLSATMRTSKPTDLILQVAAECAIETSHTRNGKTTHNEAQGTVKIWVEIDGKTVPVTAISSPPQSGSVPEVGGEQDKATFCHRHEAYSKTDGNTLCTEDATTPPPLPGAAQCETERWFQHVKTANAFNWVKMNVGSGVHTIVVRGSFRALGSTTTAGEVSTAKALVGNRTLVVEPTKMANDAVIAPSGSS